MAVCSVNKKLNFAELAKHLSSKKVEVASKEDLNQLVGYPINGISPVGLDNIPVLLITSYLSLRPY